MADFALSVKQPWATLLVHGLKTIEIRSWPTNRRGRVLIHAAGVSDKGERGWSFLPAELRQAAGLTGGIIGAGELVECIAYPTAEAFTADQARHLNDPAWHHGQTLYGFCFEQLTTLPFRRYPGWVRFFTIKDEAPQRKAKR